MKPRDARKIQQIFAATLQLVLEKGLAGITMNEIAREAAIATGTLYIYFASKEELINALFAQCRQSAAAIYFKGYRAEDSFKISFKRIWHNILNHRIQHFNEAIFLEQCYHSPYINENMKEVSRQLVQPLFELIEKGQHEHWIKTMEVDLLLTHVVGSINNIARHCHYAHKRLKPDTLQQLFELCWDGIKE